MTKPMTDERFKRIAEAGGCDMCDGLLTECAWEIRRLREENKRWEKVYLHAVGENRKDFVEITKLRKVVGLALDCWGPVDKRPRTDFVLRSKAFIKALRGLGGGKEKQL